MDFRTGMHWMHIQVQKRSHIARQYSHSGDHTLQATDRAIKEGLGRWRALDWVKETGYGTVVVEDTRRIC